MRNEYNSETVEQRPNKVHSAQFTIRLSYKYENYRIFQHYIRIWIQTQVKCQANSDIFDYYLFLVSSVSNWISNAKIGIHRRLDIVKYFYSLKFMVHLIEWKCSHPGIKHWLNWIWEGTKSISKIYVRCSDDIQEPQNNLSSFFLSQKKKWASERSIKII